MASIQNKDMQAQFCLQINRNADRAYLSKYPAEQEQGGILF